LTKYTTFIEEIFLPGYSLYQLDAWYPGVKKDGGPGVLCELYNLDEPHVLRQLDQYEGYCLGHEKSSLFVRRNVTLPDGKGEAYLYLYNHEPSGTLIEDGDWNAFKQLHSVAAA
jgi:gamma-glutamylcyclotransferase (GGCT)/AIG2-like uncharacterized protein YtfP